MDKSISKICLFLQLKYVPCKQVQFYFLLCLKHFCPNIVQISESTCCHRLFTALYFSVRSSRSSALCVRAGSYYNRPENHANDFEKVYVTGCHLAWVSKLLRGRGGLGGSEKNIFLAPPPRAIIPDARHLGTFGNQHTRDRKTQYI